MEGSRAQEGNRPVRSRRRAGSTGTVRSAGGQEVLDWLCSEEATSAARRRLARSGFDPQAALVDDVVSDARVAVIARMRSPEPLAPDSPAGYGTTVINNLVKKLDRGEVLLVDDLDPEALPPEVPIEDRTGDEVRLLLESTTADPWLTSAALAYVCMLMDPESIPESTPSPQAGARPDQALAWPALWFAGERDVFPDPDPDGEGDPRKRTRARRIRRVLEHVEAAFARYRDARGFGDG